MQRFVEAQNMKTQSLLLCLGLALMLGLGACNKASSEGKAAASSSSAAADLAGQWEGKLAVGKGELRLLLKVTKAPEGNYLAYIDSPDQGAKDIPVTSVLYNHPQLLLELD